MIYPSEGIAYTERNVQGRFAVELIMSQSEPPVPPPVGYRDESPLQRAQNHVRHVVYAAATVFATVWCYQIHTALGLTATFLAKHILVAILARALRLPIREGKT
jgi:hypothetical protein